MYQRRRRRPVSEMNVVPYIDVMLVLLIIFMATASVIAQGVNVDLPKAQAQSLETDQETILIVSIDAQGQYYINVGDNPDTPLQPQSIAAIVKTRLGADPSIPVVVNGDRNISYEKVIDMMVLLQVSGATSVGLMTDPNS